MAAVAALKRAERLEGMVYSLIRLTRPDVFRPLSAKGLSAKEIVAVLPFGDDLEYAVYESNPQLGKNRFLFFGIADRRETS
jgi:hypothetical protein